MSFEADIEHIWTPPEQLAPTLKHHFAKGACVVFANENFVAAIPATNKETNMLADLLEGCSVALDDDFTGARKEYFELRDELCAPLGVQTLSLVFRQEMEKVKKHEEAATADPRCKLATAARPRKHELN